MMTRSDTRKGQRQGDLFNSLLRDLVSPCHAMVKFADAIDWQNFEDGLSERFCVESFLEESLQMKPSRGDVESAVQKKAVRRPTDARLYDRLCGRQVKTATENGFEFRQAYERSGKQEEVLFHS